MRNYRLDLHQSLSDFGISVATGYIQNPSLSSKYREKH